MPRREFSQSVQVAIIKRASQNDIPYCEQCQQQATRFHIDHIDPDALQIDKSKKLTPAQGQLLCLPCHRDKTRHDVAVIAEAKRREAKHLGARSRPKQPLRSVNTLAGNKPKADKLPLPPRRLMYVER
jgi:hypothetical protein